MAFTELKERNGKKYYYRVVSFRQNKKVSKKRKYLGVNLSNRNLVIKENQADNVLGVLDRRKKVLEELKRRIIGILKKNSIKKAAVFGSYARGEQRKDSDVDLLVKLGKPMGFSFFKLNAELEKILGKKVHLVTYNYLSPHIKDRVLAEEVKIL